MRSTSTIILISGLLLILILIVVCVSSRKEKFQYLSSPDYNSYLKTVDTNLKSGPYYTFNKEPMTIPVFYNYLLPDIPPIDMSNCMTHPVLQYWYTPQ